MVYVNIYSDPFYQNRELVVRSKIGEQLDRLRKELSQLDSPCEARMMRIRKVATVGDLLSMDSNSRQMILSAILYYDAYWRLESAYLMLAIGMLNVTYSNLRTCLESIVKAHIVEYLDSEAINFLRTGRINPSNISNFVPPEYNEEILKLRDAFSDWGTHSHLRSVQLGTLFGPSILDKIVLKTNIERAQTISDDFGDASAVCIKAIGEVFVLFSWIMSKGTKYRRRI